MMHFFVGVTEPADRERQQYIDADGCTWVYDALTFYSRIGLKNALPRAAESVFARSRKAGRACAAVGCRRACEDRSADSATFTYQRAGVTRGIQLAQRRTSPVPLPLLRFSGSPIRRFFWLRWGAGAPSRNRRLEYLLTSDAALDQLTINGDKPG